MKTSNDKIPISVQLRTEIKAIKDRNVDVLQEKHMKCLEEERSLMERKEITFYREEKKHVLIHSEF